MAITTISKNFGNAIKSVLPIVCGVPSSVMSGISDRYSVEISADQGGVFLGFGSGAHMFTINAYLQDKVSFTAGSKWEGIIQSIPGAETLQKTVDTVIQAAAHKTAISTMSTNRKWAGSDPIGINLKLKFEAVNDVETEVLLPCRLLQGLTLPSGGIEGFGLTPPGPSGFAIKQGEKDDLSRGETIAINIGNFLGFRSVIIKSVKVTYENRMSADGPIGAEVEMVIESWRMMTREKLSEVYDNKLEMSKTAETLGTNLAARRSST